jgi:AcrR family transcriptional regulator
MSRLAAEATVNVLSLAGLPSASAALPAVPSPALDPYLDAAAVCFARHGLSRTGVPDIARELGVSRTTVYRQVGTVEQAARLLLARELHRLLARLPALVEGATGPETFVRLIAVIVNYAREHHVLAKVLADEAEVIGPLLAGDELPELVLRVSTIASPLLVQAMDAGLVRRRDPDLLADFLVRVVVSLVLAPPPGELEAYLRETILPLLVPA